MLKMQQLEEATKAKTSVQVLLRGSRGLPTPAFSAARPGDAGETLARMAAVEQQTVPQPGATRWRPTGRA
jgi:hypothetical protein